MKLYVGFLILAIIAGAVLPLQAGLNVQLGKSVNQPLFAAFASFLIGSVGLLISLFLIKFEFSALTNLRHVPLAVWWAGVLGAFYVAAVIVLSPRLGTALTFSLVVTGQLAISLLLDHYGFFGLPVRMISWPRILGILLVIFGVVLIRKY